MNRNHSIIVQIGLIIVFGGLLITGLTYVNYQFSLNNPGGNDYLARWNGAHEWLVNGNNPYSDQVSEVAQQMIYGRKAIPSRGEDIAHFVYPLYSMIFFAPFGLLDYTLSRALWMTLLEIVAISLTFTALYLTGWKIKKFSLIGILLFSILWYCSTRTIILGQFSGINALLILLGILCIKKDKDQLGGFLLALSTSKPQMTYLLVIFIILWSIRSARHRIWISFLSSMILMIVAGWLLLPGWPIDWLRQVMNYPEYTDRIGSIVSIWAGITPGIQDQLSKGLLFFFYAYMLFEWLRTKGNDVPAFLWTSYITLVITNFVAYRTATPHYVVLMAPIFMVSRIIEERWGNFGKWMNRCSYVLLLLGYWLLFILTIYGNEEQAIMYLPVPIITLLALWWTRWWAVRPPTRLIEN